MQQSPEKRIYDRDVRHFIYANFADSSRPPTSAEAADHFKVFIATIENAYENLANAHHIALAPGSYSIWMAHPFSGLPTNYVAELEGKKYVE